MGFLGEFAATDGLCLSFGGGAAGSSVDSCVDDWPEERVWCEMP